MLAPSNADLSYCAKNPTDPTCSGLQERPNYINWMGYYATGGTPGTTKTPGTIPGQQVTTTPPPPAVAFPGYYAAGGSDAWYKTWWGLGLIGLGAFLGYKRFIAK